MDPSTPIVRDPRFSPNLLLHLRSLLQFANPTTTTTLTIVETSYSSIADPYSVNEAKVANSSFLYYSTSREILPQRFKEPQQPLNPYMGL
ncbi:hypothetical protein BofuT4_uP065030.1 [Botrytis cinerea T4]|uniref:Uncharacterized protein n=1 Tax=Botryotinia fuckeliana (strain T4) TaxID=999810 RepID=G2XSM4_BOTF4|nr:hypothetical protein BofuT4_uP065030.1 [Botrytis cinerea T4]